MRQLSIALLLIVTTFVSFVPPANCAVKGGIEYSIPIDYSKLSESELQEKAKVYYFNALKLQAGKINEDMTNALMTYSILQNVNPENTDYPVKLGILYDKAGMDRFAKGNFSKAIGLDNTKPEPYFYLGEFYYSRKLYRKSLKYYIEAYKRGFETNYDLLYKMGDIYEKFGDTRSALKYLNEAQVQSTNPELENKINRIKKQDSINREYYSDTRIRG